MGPSGSGKTTLLNLIAGLDRPTDGRISVGPNVISSMSESQLARWRTRSVGFVFQFYYLLPVLTAFENVELPLLLLPLTKEQRRKQVSTALDLVGLSDRLTHRPGQLSGGQQQRVGIGQDACGLALGWQRHASAKPQAASRFQEHSCSDSTSIPRSPTRH